MVDDETAQSPLGACDQSFYFAWVIFWCCWLFVSESELHDEMDEHFLIVCGGVITNDCVCLSGSCKGELVLVQSTLCIINALTCLDTCYEASTLFEDIANCRYFANNPYLRYLKSYKYPA